MAGRGGTVQGGTGAAAGDGDGAGMPGRGGTGAFSGDGAIGGAGGEGDSLGGSFGVCRAPATYSANADRCAGPFLHRKDATLRCPVPVRDSELGLPDDAGVERICSSDGHDCVAVNECTRDDDCGNSGYCTRVSYYETEPSERISAHLCVRGCETDSDCSTNELCLCDSVTRNATRTDVAIGRCVPATCRTDAECANDGLCIAPVNVIPHWQYTPSYESFNCQLPTDQCSGPGECPEPEERPCCDEAFCRFRDGQHRCSVRSTCDLC